MRQGLLAAVLAALLAGGCIMVRVDSVRDPDPAFREARREALRYQGRRGPAHEVNVLVYDADERKLVRVRVPMWLVRRLERHVDLGEGGEGAERAVRRQLRLEDIEKAGLGILVEVEQDDGEQVLVWLR